MKFFSHTSPSQESALRGRLLLSTLRQYCSGNRQAVFSGVTPIQDGSAPVSVLESLSAFPKARNVDLAFFDGVVNAPEAHLGRNVLVCAHPLQDELSMFAARTGVDTSASPMWWKNILRNFERVILLDRNALARSVGYSPWVRLGLSDHFPVILNGTDRQRDKGKILVLNHDPAAGAKEIRELHDRLCNTSELSFVTADGQRAPTLEEMATAAIHIHYGFDSHLPTAGLTPFDSLANGIYTVVLPAPIKLDAAKGNLSRAESTRMDVDARVLKEVRARSYAVVAEDLDEVQAFVERTQDRLGRFAQEKLSINPELQRFERMNEDYVATMLARFTKQVQA